MTAMNKYIHIYFDGNWQQHVLEGRMMKNSKSDTIPFQTSL